MKKTVLILSAIALTMQAKAQTVVSDSVLLTAGYANQVWYSLDNDEQANAPKNDWDIAFDVKSILSSVHINSVAGVTLWAYPKAGISGWASVDTSGLSTWNKRYNSDTSWSYGAMGNYSDPNDPTDLDWGKYDMSTHIVTGDSLYIIKLANGDYKKLTIEALSGGTFTFKYADINGSNPQTATIVKSNFTGKNFAYYSIANNAALPAGREPNADTWDLLFTQYTAFVPQAYTVTGVLQNRGARVAKAANLNDKNSYNDWAAHTTESAINGIGYNWKSFNGTGYAIKDSTVYFVKAVNGDIWKIIFTGFASADGKSAFTKQKLQTAGIKDAGNGYNAGMAVYPNPSISQNVTVVYNFETPVCTALLVIYDLSGKQIFKDKLDNNPGLHQYVLPSIPAAGTYIVLLETDLGRAAQKLIIQ